MLLLALDTATPAVTVAVHDGQHLLAAATEVGARRHGELLAVMVGDVLGAASRTVSDLTDIAVGVGPGPYTSLRVGLVTALALGLASGARVHGVCSLDALAWEVANDARWSRAIDGGFLVATDARRREVYWATYAADGTRTAGPAVDRPATVAAEHRGRAVVGEGALLHPDELGTPVGPTYPSAAALAEVAVATLTSGAALLPVVPLYLRRPDAAEPATRKRVLR